MAKKTTIEDLARMTQNEFSSLHDQLSGLQAGIAELHKDVSSGFAEMHQAFGEIKALDHERRLIRIERKLGLAIG